MSNLCHYDVEQGRFDEAEESVAEALRISEERDTPSCTAFQLGVRSRLRLLQGRLAEAEDDARAVLSSSDVPLGQLWPHLVLGMLVARRDGSPANPHLDELWRLVNSLDNPGMVAAVAAALAENAWITRRPDARLDDPLVTELFTREWAGREAALAALQRWSRRLAEAGIQQVDPALPNRADPGPVPESQSYERAMALWDAGTTDDLLAALPLLDDLDARAVAALFRARLRDAGVSSVPRGRLAATRANPAGLTARQLDVLALLADGLSNADIAARLVISPKTADHHVSAILAKLDVRTRGDAAAVARRLGVMPAASLGVRAPARSFEALVDDDAQVHAEGDADRVAGDVGGPVEMGHHLAEGHDRHHGVDGAEPGRRALAAAGRQRDADLPHGHFENDQHGDEHGLQVCLHRLLLESEGAVAAAAAVALLAGGEEQVLPVEHRRPGAAVVTHGQVGQVAVERLDLGGVAADVPVDRDGRSVDALPVLPPRLGRREAVRGQRLPAGDDVGHPVAEQGPDVVLVAPQRRRLRAGRRRGRVRLHRREHLADEPLRGPAQQADPPTGAAHAEQLVRGAWWCGANMTPTQTGRRRSCRRRTATPRRRPPRTRPSPCARGELPTRREQFRGQVGGHHVGAGERGGHGGVPGAGGDVEHPVAGAHAGRGDEGGPQLGITSMATAG